MQRLEVGILHKQCQGYVSILLNEQRMNINVLNACYIRFIKRGNGNERDKQKHASHSFMLLFME